MLSALIQLARPKDWVKNIFVILPVPFALAAEANRVDWAMFALGLVGFCLINSAVYVLNDLRDSEADRLHPRKRNRPIASGRVSRPAAVAEMTVLLYAGLAASFFTGKPLALFYAGVYLIINLFYSLGMKNIPLMDVFMLSSGYVIRVLLGCALVAAAPSPWLLLCTGTLALFLGFAKRRADLSEQLGADHRASLRGYDKTFLMETAPQLGVRITRVLEGDATLSLDKARSGAVWPDSVAVGGAWFGDHIGWQIPYGALLSKNIDNILTAGRSISAEPDMSDLVRVIPDCWITGQAAGCAAAAAVREKTAARDTPVEAIRSLLRDQGAYLG